MRVALFARSGRGYGSGHLMRSFQLQRSLRQRGVGALLFLDEGGPEDLPSGFAVQPFESGWDSIPGDVFLYADLEKVMESGDSPRVGFDLAVTDGREHSKNYFNHLLSLAPQVVALDDYSEWNLPGLRYIDTLLYPDPAARPGNSNRSYSPQCLILNIPDQGGDDVSGNEKKYDLLVLPGNRDPFHIENQALKILQSFDGFGSCAMFCSLDREKRRQFGGSGLELFSYQDDFSKLFTLLGSARYVATYYGLSALESLYAGTHVLLFAPTDYHGQLAQALHREYPDYTYFHSSEKTLAETLVRFKMSKVEWDSLYSQVDRSRLTFDASGATRLASMLIEMATGRV